MGDSLTTSRLIGRNDEKEKLGRALASTEAEFVAVYGRRRVGKTFLVRELLGEAIRFELTGMHGVSMRDQLCNFASALARAKGLEERLQPPATWREAFAQRRSHGLSD